MDINEIQRRLQEIDAQLRQTLANYNALEGAKQELSVWLAKLMKEEEEKKKAENGEAISDAVAS